MPSAEALQRVCGEVEADGEAALHRARAPLHLRTHLPHAVRPGMEDRRQCTSVPLLWYFLESYTQYEL